jgi:crotonobetainyl-CoA:carnitine CoA-transferase CaiB-like acyl-CoA transferase
MAKCMSMNPRYEKLLEPGRIGEHNAEVYGELGLTGERIEELKKTGVI